MKKLLLVDDDAVLTRAYRDRLSKHGFQVNTVGSGAGALLFLEAAKPDLVVLDLMMQEVSGVDVLKFVRGESRLADTPVVVLTNEPGNDLGGYAARIGIQKAFRKDQCSPTALIAAIDEILEPPTCRVQSEECRIEDAAAPEREMQKAEGRIEEPITDPATPLDALDCRMENAECRMDAPTTPAEAAPECGIQGAECRIEEPAETPECRIQDADGTEASASLLADAAVICAELGDLFAALSRESLTGPEQRELLQDLFLKVRFLAEKAGLTELAALAQAAAVFDALLSVLMENPEWLGPSALRTVEGLVEVIGLLFEQARESGSGTPLSARVLVVDDDPAANEMVVAALCRAQIDACSTEDSLAAWQWINSEQFDVVLLRMEMPVINGLQLCERVRKVEGYENTPVIFVAAQDDHDNRAASSLVGADDLIAKSILPEELVARVVGHLVGTQISELNAGGTA